MPNQEIKTYRQASKRARLLRIGRRLGGERLLFLAARVFGRLRIEGEDRIPKEGACLLPFNHVSQVTTLLTVLLIRQVRPDIRVFGYQLLGDDNPLRHFMAELGEDQIEERVLNAYKALGLSAWELLKGRDILLDGGCIAIAAEGEFTWDGRLQHPLAPGTAWLALVTGAPIIPVVSSGGYDIQPRWNLDRIRLPGRVTLRIGEPFSYPEGPLRYPPDELIATANQRLWDEMARLLG
jgi:1-acyl-sn-glycerol-3-phosphate acyltransferase